MLLKDEEIESYNKFMVMQQDLKMLMIITMLMMIMMMRNLMSESYIAMTQDLMLVMMTTLTKLGI